MNYEQFVKEMRKIAKVSHDDTEDAHWQADKLLIKFIRKNGYDTLADAYEKVAKWYD